MARFQLPEHVSHVIYQFPGALPIQGTKGNFVIQNVSFTNEELAFPSEGEPSDNPFSFAFEIHHMPAYVYKNHAEFMTKSFDPARALMKDYEPEDLVMVAQPLLDLYFPGYNITSFEEVADLQYIFNIEAV